MQKNILKIFTYIAFGLTAIFMVIAVSMCVNYLIWNSKGEKTTARYMNNKIYYTADSEYINVELPNKYKKYVDKDNLIVIIYNHQQHNKFYCVKSISNVFIFAGIGTIFLIGTLVLYFSSNKKPKESSQVEVTSEVKVKENKEDNDEIEMVRITPKEKNGEDQE